MIIPCVCTLYIILHNLLVVSPHDFEDTSVFLSTGLVRLLHVNVQVFQSKVLGVLDSFIYLILI